MQECQICHKYSATIFDICAECDIKAKNVTPEDKPSPNVQSFRINGYEADFVRFHMTELEVIFFFMDLCRINHVMQIGLIIRPMEILIDKNYLEDFVDWCEDLGIHFVDENFKFPKNNEWMQNATDIFSNKTEVVKTHRKNAIQEKQDGEFIVRDLI